jgi:hypothetical protein
LVATIDPERGPQGRNIEFVPQSRYENRRALSLNKHAGGPFCRFPLAGVGVYLFVVDGGVSRLRKNSFEGGVLTLGE